MAKKHRSPSYPSINLESAIALARKVYPGAKHPIGATVIAEQWGYKGIASASPYISALKQFGLLKESKSNGERMLNLTNSALDILVDPELESKQSKVAINECSVKPRIHSDLIDRWDGELPPDGEIRRYLERERDFNPKHVDSFIDQFKETLNFAKSHKPFKMQSLLDDLTQFPTQKASSGEPKPPNDEKNDKSREKSNLFFSQSPSLPNGGVKMIELPITLPTLKIAVIKVPEKMTNLEYETLMATLTGFKSALVKEQIPIDYPIETDESEND